MYCVDFICTYKKHDEEDQEDIYRDQFLQAFNLNTWDDEKIENTTKELYDKIKDSNDLDDIINKIKQSNKFSQIISFIGNNNSDIFKILFMFDLFDLSHNCFRDILTNKIMSQNNKTIIMNNI